MSNIEKKILRRIEQELEEDRMADAEIGIKENLPNQCLGVLLSSEIRCQVMLPLGQHYCKECKAKKDALAENKAVKGYQSRAGNILAGIANT